MGLQANLTRTPNTDPQRYVNGCVSAEACVADGTFVASMTSTPPSCVPNCVPPCARCLHYKRDSCLSCIRGFFMNTTGGCSPSVVG